MESKELLAQQMIAEYTALKAEQTQRLNARDHSVIGNFVTVGGLSIFAILNREKQYEVALAIPFISFCACWLYANNSLVIVRMQRYFAFDYRNRFEALATGATFNPYHHPYNKQSPSSVCSWEFYDPYRNELKVRNIMKFFAVLISFFLINVAVLIMYCIYSPSINQLESFALYTGWIITLINLLVILMILGKQQRISRKIKKRIKQNEIQLTQNAATIPVS